jgi:hypothetical protein
MTIAPAPLELRAAPAGLPDPDVTPPVVAERGDPFATLRVIHLLARIPRGRALRLSDLVDRLNAEHVDWLFDQAIVTDVVVQLQANWMTDYRNVGGLVVEDSPFGPTVALEDSSRVDPWIVRQATLARAACDDALLAFSRRDRVTGE